MTQQRQQSGQDTGGLQLFLAFARGIAFFIGGFSLLNILGQMRFPGFDANHWWIDFRPVPAAAARLFLMAASVFLIAYSCNPRMSRWRRGFTLGLVGALLINTVRNTAHFYLLLARGRITAGCPVAFSLLVGMGLVVVLLGVLAARAKPDIKTRLSAKVVFAITIIVCLVGFPLGQMFCFGKTDYRREAEAIVVFGARVYTDGRCSDALADRVRTGCRLYQSGLAKLLIFSGGPGDGEAHETEAMRRMAIKLGVPEEAIVMDREGVSTRATVRNTCEMFERMGMGRVLAVSHFYHLPRIKMSYQRRGREVLTVPARESYVLTEMPKYILREVAALWVYYLRPLVP